MIDRPKALFLLNTDAYHSIYGAAYADIARLVDLYAEPQTAESAAANPDVLREVDIIFSGWGCPTFDQTLLDHAPRLKAIFYGAGTIRQIVTPAFWERGIVITSGAAANALPVAEYTLGNILLSLKGVWFYARLAREKGTLTKRGDFPGGYGSTVGIISLGLIGRRVCDLLKPFDLQVIACDPYVSPSVAEELGVEMCSLDDLFRRADVVSLHTPWLPETEGLITGDHLRTMRPNSTFINTARGAVVREAEMIGALAERGDITAILDVTHPEPPDADSPLYTLPNVILTPHIAGALGAERERLGTLVLAELRRYLNGEALAHQVTREQAARMA